MIKINLASLSTQNFFLTFSKNNLNLKFYPRWLPPNVLTLGGFLILISSFILVSIYDYNFNSNTFGSKQEEETIPNWIWLICSIATFLAHLLDGTDGKQARRTGSCGPTGELCLFFFIFRGYLKFLGT